MSRAFIDSNILVYAFSTDARQTRARIVLEHGGVISVQCLNEFANVARRKLGFDWPQAHEAHEALDAIRALCRVALPIDVAIHEHGLRLSERHGLSLYDAMIIAAAMRGECELLWSEDMQHGLVVDERLRIVNPFHEQPAG